LAFCSCSSLSTLRLMFALLKGPCPLDQVESRQDTGWCSQTPSALVGPRCAGCTQLSPLSFTPSAQHIESHLPSSFRSFLAQVHLVHWVTTQRVVHSSSQRPYSIALREGAGGTLHFPLGDSKHTRGSCQRNSHHQILFL
jgi:hypothetical protein